MLTNLNLCILKSVAYLCIAVWWQYWILSQIPTSVKLGGWGGIFGKTTNSICVSALQCKGQLSSTLIHKIWFLSPVILWSKIFSSDLWKAPSQIGKGISEREREGHLAAIMNTTSARPPWLSSGFARFQAPRRPSWHCAPMNTTWYYVRTIQHCSHSAVLYSDNMLL